NTDDLFVGKTLLHGDVLMWLMKTLLTSGCTNQRGAGQGDEIRSILDGHIYLSRKLAGQGHYPAIDVLKSVSRVFGQVTDEKHRDNAARVRKILTTLEDLQVFIDLGEYRAGQNAENDFAMNARPKLTNWLKQSVNEKMPMSETLKELERIVK
ncbi:hypothetical protein ACLEYP_24565, partial [Escherichia coli]